MPVTWLVSDQLGWSLNPYVSPNLTAQPYSVSPTVHQEFFGNLASHMHHALELEEIVTNICRWCQRSDLTRFARCSKFIAPITKKELWGYHSSMSLLFGRLPGVTFTRTADRLVSFSVHERMGIFTSCDRPLIGYQRLANGRHSIRMPR